MERDIDFKELEAFIHVLELRSFSKAARRLYLSQPTVSGYIASLERKLGSKLLIRTTKEIFPSETGNVVYGYAKEILRLREATVQAVESLHTRMKGVISVAASTIPGQYYLPKLLRAFREKYPDISFNLQMADSAEVVDLVTARKVDIGFTGARFNNTKCVFSEFADDRLVIITPNEPRFQAFSQTAFPTAQLAKETFICREEGSGTRMEAEQFLRRMGVDPGAIDFAVEVRSTESIKQMVSEGVGISIISERASRDYCAFGKLLAFDADNVNIRRKLHVLRHKNGILSPVSQVFFDFAQVYFRRAENMEDAT